MAKGKYEVVVSDGFTTHRVTMTRKKLGDAVKKSLLEEALASAAIEGEGLPGVAADDLMDVVPDVPDELLTT